METKPTCCILSLHKRFYCLKKIHYMDTRPNLAPIYFFSFWRMKWALSLSLLNLLMKEVISCWILHSFTSHGTTKSQFKYCKERQKERKQQEKQRIPNCFSNTGVNQVMAELLAALIPYKFKLAYTVGFMSCLWDCDYIDGLILLEPNSGESQQLHTSPLSV